jgi:tRNA (cmo5U34)-methyltransferase
MNNIKETFGAIAATYDGQRRQLVPCFDDFYGLPLQAMDFAGDAPRVLDLGAGSGLFSALLLAKYPRARITLVDLSDKMLSVAKKRFEGRDYAYVESSFGDLDLPESSFDIVISALAIHHIPGPEKEALYNKAFHLLAAEGTFVNCDQIHAPDAVSEARNIRLWKEFIEASGLPRAEIDAAYERMKLDRTSTVEDQLGWLRKAGFAQVDLLYKFHTFAVFFAKKQAV